MNVRHKESLVIKFISNVFTLIIRFIIIKLSNSFDYNLINQLLTFHHHDFQRETLYKLWLNSAKALRLSVSQKMLLLVIVGLGLVCLLIIQEVLALVSSQYTGNLTNMFSSPRYLATECLLP